MSEEKQQSERKQPQERTPMEERSPRVREILEKKPRFLFRAGIAAIIFGVLVLLWVIAFLSRV